MDSLTNYMQKLTHNLVENEITNIFMQLVNGCKYLHEKGIFDLDLTPDNILISNYDTVKIDDYGLISKIA